MEGTMLTRAQEGVEAAECGEGELRVLMEEKTAELSRLMHEFDEVAHQFQVLKQGATIEGRTRALEDELKWAHVLAAEAKADEAVALVAEFEAQLRKAETAEVEATSEFEEARRASARSLSV
jgi:hypothetical protein